MPNDRTAFFYGTLMALSVLQRVTSHPSASPLKIRPAILPHHRRHRIRSADYPAILPVPSPQTHSSSKPAASDPQSSSSAGGVRGTYVTGLSTADIRRLDIFEGSEYERRKVKVRLLRVAEGKMHSNHHGGEEGEEEEEEEVETETYVWTASPAELEDGEWDFEEFVREKMWRWADPGEDVDSGFADVGDAVGEVEGVGRDPTGGRGAGGFEREVVRSAV